MKHTAMKVEAKTSILTGLLVDRNIITRELLITADGASHAIPTMISTDFVRSLREKL